MKFTFRDTSGYILETRLKVWETSQEPVVKFKNHFEPGQSGPVG